MKIENEFCRTFIDLSSKNKTFKNIFQQALSNLILLHFETSLCNEYQYTEEDKKGEVLNDLTELNSKKLHRMTKEI